MVIARSWIQKMRLLSIDEQGYYIQLNKEGGLPNLDKNSVYKQAVFR